MKIGVYPGSFDPFTIGHLDVLKSAAELFDLVYVAVLNNSAKSPVFTVQERLEMIDRMIETEGFNNVRSGAFAGLLVDYAEQINAHYLIRGFRIRIPDRRGQSPSETGDPHGVFHGESRAFVPFEFECA